jgi:hypothetical protein
MTRSIKGILILIMTLLIYSPCFASESSLRVFDTDHFTVNLPAHMRQLKPIDDKSSRIYTFVESNKVRKKRISLIVNLGKIDNPQPIALKEISIGLRNSAASHSDCRSRTSELTETHVAGRKGFYFQKSNEGCVVVIERYWMAMNGDYFFAFCLTRPVKGDDAVFRRIEKEIVKIKLKSPK